MYTTSIHTSYMDGAFAPPRPCLQGQRLRTGGQLPVVGPRRRVRRRVLRAAQQRLPGRGRLGEQLLALQEDAEQHPGGISNMSQHIYSLYNVLYSVIECIYFIFIFIYLLTIMQEMIQSHIIYISGLDMMCCRSRPPMEPWRMYSSMACLKSSSERQFAKVRPSKRQAKCLGVKPAMQVIEAEDRAPKSSLSRTATLPKPWAILRTGLEPFLT